ncbi:MAG: flagellin FliC [Oligoflexia bacterium]|nr:flagellin FliC [Oligoflexia bacterium]
MSGDSTSSRVSLRFLSSALNSINKSDEKLASGKRINRASDDAAGLAIADALQADAAVFKQASNNAGYAQSLLSIQDGALESVNQIGTRLAELSTQAANGTLSDSQRSALNEEYQALSQEAQRIVDSTEFNGQKVFSGESTSFQIGLDSGSDSQITLQGSDLGTLVSSIAGKDISTQAGARQALDASTEFVKSISQKRGQIGSVSSRLETATSNIDVATENLRSAESRIRDVDVAEEVASKTAATIKANASIGVQAQGKLSAANVLKLLR